MVREIGVQADEASVARPVESGDGVPGWRRRLAVEAQIALAPAFDHGVAHVDGNALRLAAAQFPDFGRGKAGGGDAGLRGGGHAE